MAYILFSHCGEERSAKVLHDIMLLLPSQTHGVLFPVCVIISYSLLKSKCETPTF